MGAAQVGREQPGRQTVTARLRIPNPIVQSELVGWLTVIFDQGRFEKGVDHDGTADQKGAAEKNEIRRHGKYLRWGTC